MLGQPMSRSNDACCSVSTLGHHAQSERGGQRQRRPDDGAAVPPRLVRLAQILNERLVDLEFVDLQLAQEQQGGVAGAEIVHRDAGAPGPHLLEGGLQTRQIADQRGFGQFDDQPVGTKTVTPRGASSVA